MREVSEDYKAVVKGNTRKIGFVCALQGERSFGAGDIVELNITRAACDGFQIGATCSDRLQLLLKATDRIQKGTRIYARFYVGSMTNLHLLGTFYADEVTTDGGITTVIAYDRMNAKTLDTVVKWTASGAPAFPCKQQDILDYLCARKQLDCDFVCDDLTVQEEPVGYTARELIGFIAASHAANAHFDAEVKLTFRRFSKVDYRIDKLRCYSHAAGNDNGFTVKGILFNIGNDTQIYIDGDSNEYDEDNPEGVIECFNPFASIEIAEKCWHLLGGLTYYSAELEMPAENILELGDVFTTNGPQGGDVQSVVLEQELSVSIGDGFTERISAAAESNSNQRSTNNRVSSAENKVAQGGSSGTVTSYEYLSDPSVKLNGTTYTIEKNAAGLISKITDSLGNTLKPTVSGEITDIVLHNAALWGAVLARGIGKAPEVEMPDMTGIVGYFIPETRATSENLWKNFLPENGDIDLVGGTDVGSSVYFGYNEYGIINAKTIAPRTVYCIFKNDGPSGYFGGFVPVFSVGIDSIAMHKVGASIGWHTGSSRNLNYPGFSNVTSSMSNISEIKTILADDIDPTEYIVCAYSYESDLKLITLYINGKYIGELTLASSIYAKKYNYLHATSKGSAEPSTTVESIYVSMLAYGYENHSQEDIISNSEWLLKKARGDWKN